MQSVADLDRIAEAEANNAQLMFEFGREGDAVIAAWHSLILFAAVDELRRRGRR